MENKLMPMVEDAIKDTPLNVLSEINHGDTKLEVEITDDTPSNSDEECTAPEGVVDVVEKELIPPQEIFKDIIPVIKKPKRTRKMTPEALEKLALARAKGNETRKRNKELRMKGDMPTPTQKKSN